MVTANKVDNQLHMERQSHKPRNLKRDKPLIYQRYPPKKEAKMTGSHKKLGKTNHTIALLPIVYWKEKRRKTQDEI